MRIGSVPAIGERESEFIKLNIDVRKDPTMQRVLSAQTMFTATVLLSACVRLAPGADQVRITNKASDVETCKALGNIQVPKNDQGLADAASAQNQFRNQAVGLGSNVAFVTEGFVSIPVAGIAYRCP
jgi:hypothetical protein